MHILHWCFSPLPWIFETHGMLKSMKNLNIDRVWTSSVIFTAMLNWIEINRGEPGEVGRGRTETPPFLGSNCFHMNFVDLKYSNFMNDNAVNFVFRSSSPRLADENKD